jgi:hypothetical protein
MGEFEADVKDTGSATSTPDTDTLVVSNDVTPSPSSGDTPGANTADTPAAKDELAKTDLLSVIKDAVKFDEDKDADNLDAPKPETDPATTKSATDPSLSDTGKVPDPKSTDAKASTDPSPEELKTYSPRVQERIRGLVSERNEWRDKFQAFETQVAQLQPLAEQTAQLQSFMQQHGLEGQEVQLGYGVMAALKRGDFRTFVDTMQPYMDAARMYLGEILPPDVQREVDQGLISEERGRELTRLRGQSSQLQGAVSQLQTTAVQQQQVSTVETSKLAVNQWEQGVKASDPDFAAKQPMLLRFAQAMVMEQGGPPRTPQEAVDLAKRAYEEVNKTFTTLRPQPKPTRPSPMGGQVSNPVVSQPSNMMEAAMLGLQRARTAS